MAQDDPAGSLNHTTTGGSAAIRGLVAATSAWALGLLAVVCAVAWIGSFWFQSDAYLGHHRGVDGMGLNLRTSPGALEVVLIAFESEPVRSAEGLITHAGVRRRDRFTIGHRDWVRFGFGAARWQETVRGFGPTYTNRFHGLSVPLWLLVLVFGAFPLWWGWPSARRKRRARRGLCSACGYDLRGSVGSECPECGGAYVSGKASGVSETSGGQAEIVS